MSVPTGFSAITPYVFATNAGAYVDFLIQAFGAVELGRSLRPDGCIANCQLRIETATIMISEASPAFPPTPASYYVYVDDADAAMGRALAAGGDQIMPVEDRIYGDRQGGVRDPAGTLWWISQRLTEHPYY